MKLKEVEVEVPKPPKRVILDLSQEEAGLLREFVVYYASNAAPSAAWSAAAAELRNRLEPYRGMYKHPYTDYFKECK